MSVKRDTKKSAEPRFAYDGLDRVIHERARLSLLTSLATHPKGLSFTELKQLCALTDGNLNRHLQVLEEAEMVAITKSLEQTRTQTSARLTAGGRKRYNEYLSVLESVLMDANAAEASRGDAATAPSAKRRGGATFG
jgi:DNA-binding MarR family transcriptional regulator